MIDSKIIIENLKKIRENSPLVHNITNYVVMNNTANALLSIGASPVMAHAKEEVEDMVSIASSLVINMGTLSSKWVESMLIAGDKANSMGKPIVFDPVGVGASTYRTETAINIIDKCSPSVIRGNASEIIALNSQAKTKTKGVDSTDSSDSALESAKSLALNTSSVVVISGETDYITDGKKVVAIENGSSMMPKVTGMGCTSTAIVGAFLGVSTNILEAASSAMAVMGISGEIASEISKGPGSLQMNFLDTIYNLEGSDIEKRLKIRNEGF
ncbi:MAG: hydroxyethylthiazole kinase [Marinifilaceae bacterium]|jgi:hydroxyethylthiazole kinase|nr:hydroxyethylthiazole kinase [Marinifilaceae bacterium]